MFALASAPAAPIEVTIISSWLVILGGGKYCHQCDVCGITTAAVASEYLAELARDQHDRAEHRATLTYSPERAAWLVPDEAADTAPILSQTFPGQAFTYADTVQVWQAPVSFLIHI